MKSMKINENLHYSSIMPAMLISLLLMVVFVMYSMPAMLISLLLMVAFVM